MAASPTITIKIMVATYDKLRKFEKKHKLKKSLSNTIEYLLKNSLSLSKQNGQTNK